MTMKEWLVRHQVLHVNHWWGISLFGWHLYWNRRPVLTRNYPHTEH